MRKPFWARLLVLVMLLAAFPYATPAQAANEAPPLALASLSYPAQVVAGNTVTFAVEASGDAEVGINNGGLTLKGPSGQAIAVDLFRRGNMSLVGSVTLSPNTQPGTWTVGSLYLVDTDETTKNYTADSNFKYTLTVSGSGQAVDTQAPELVSVSVPDEVTMGEPVTVTAKVTDTGAGVSRVIAYIAPATEKPNWTDSIELYPTDKPGEYAGVVLMDTVTMLAEKQAVTKIWMRDQAGNVATVDAAAMAKNKDNKLETKAKQRKVPEGLVTSPYINLIHPGELAFWTWLGLDYQYSLNLLKQMDTDPTTVRELIAAQLPQLQAAIAGLRKEVYVDPDTKLRISPFSTSGKWLVLDGAVDARMELLTELDRREGRTRGQRAPLTTSAIASFYSFLSEGEQILPAENTGNDTFGQIPAAYLYALSQSPEAVAALKMPANEDLLSAADTFDRDTIYFMPILTTRLSRLTWGTNSVRIYIGPRSMSTNIHDLFYSIGQHFGQAYFSALFDKEFDTKWGPYLRLRGNQSWSSTVGWLGTPMNNIGDDFAYSFLPMGLGRQYFSRQSYPRLRENPQMLDAFKKLVVEMEKKPVPTSSVVGGEYLQVGLGANLTVTVNGAKPTSVLEAEGIRWNAPAAKEQKVPGVTSNGMITFTSDVTVLGNVTWFVLAAADNDGRTFNREIRYYRAPVLLDSVPAATNQDKVKVSGTTTPGVQVDVAGQKVTADSQGRFTATVPLAAGDNRIRVLPAGAPLGAIVKVQYEAAAQIPVKVQVPGVSQQTRVAGSIQTAPFASVTLNGMRAQADAKGYVPFVLPLKDGSNKVQVTAVSPSGNTGSWSGMVLVDSTPPVLTVSVPIRTNQQVLQVTGKVDRGSILTLDENEVTVAADGSFSADIALTAGESKTLHFTATDSAGNQASTTATVTYVKGVPTVTRTASTELTGLLQPGTTLTLEGTPVNVLLDGSFSLRVPTPAGRNVFNLNATYDGKPIGFIQFVVVNPLQVTAVQREGEQVRIAGTTLPGYKVTVAGQSVTPNEKGEWTVTIDPQGRPSVEVTVQGDGETYSEIEVLP